MKKISNLVARHAAFDLDLVAVTGGADQPDQAASSAGRPPRSITQSSRFNEEHAPRKPVTNG